MPLALWQKGQVDLLKTTTRLALVVAAMSSAVLRLSMPAEKCRSCCLADSRRGSALSSRDDDSEKSEAESDDVGAADRRRAELSALRGASEEARRLRGALRRAAAMAADIASVEM